MANGRYGEVGKPTASPVEAFTAFGTGSGSEVDDGGALERERARASEDESNQVATKTPN